jgi:hypothetical protein
MNFNFFKKTASVLLFSALLFNAQKTVSQTSGGISTVLEPKKSQGYLFWNDASSSTVDHYQIDIVTVEGYHDSIIYEEEIDFSERSMTIQNSYSTENSYYRVPDDDINSEYMYIISSVNSNGDIIDSDEPRPLCSGCWTEPVCKTKCLGTQYAWQVVYRTGQNAQGYPSNYATLESSGITLPDGSSVPHYKYVNQGSFNSWIQGKDPGNYPNAGLVSDQSLDCYKTSSGNSISGPVYQIPLDLGQWSGSQKIIRNVNVNSICNSNDVQWSTIDLYNTNNISPELKCDEYPSGPCGNYGGGAEGGSDDPWGDYPEAYAVKFHFNGDSIWVGNGTGGGSWDPIDNDLPVDNFNKILAPISDALTGYDRPTEGNSGSFASDISNLIVHPVKVDNYHPDIELVGEDLFPSSADFDSVTLNLSNGFYRATINFEDHTSTPFYFVYENEEEEGSLSEKVDVTAYPVPVSQNSFSVDLSLIDYEDNINTNYKLIDLTGNVLDSKSNITISSEGTTSFNSQFTGDYSNQMLVIRLSLSDGSKKDVSIWVE